MGEACAHMCHCMLVDVGSSAPGFAQQVPPIAILNGSLIEKYNLLV